MKNVLLTLGLGSLVLWLYHRPSAAQSPIPEVPGTTTVKAGGHTWLLEPVLTPDRASGTQTTNVYAPAGSWGPHSKLLIARFTQANAAADRILSGAGADVPEAMFSAALKDLDISPPLTS